MKRAAIALVLLAGPALAAQEPKPGRFDARMQFVAYNPNNVVILNCKTFSSTQVTFAEGEKIAYVLIGDEEAWLATPVDNILFIKPTEVRQKTNMQVVTSLKDGKTRTYAFELVPHPGAAPAPNNQVADVSGATVPVATNGPITPYTVSFVYPGDRADAARAARQAQREHADEQVAQSRLATDWFMGPRNWHYGAQGAASIEPFEVSDNGQLTAMRFPGNSILPTIYAIPVRGFVGCSKESQQQETIVPYRMQGDVVVVSVTAPEFCLRYGSEALRIINYAFNQVGYNPQTGTTSPEVIRNVRPGAP